MRALPSNSRGLSALGISGEDEEKQQHFCYCSSPFYSAACVGSLLSVALFGCIFSMVKIFVGNSFAQFIFHTLKIKRHLSAIDAAAKYGLSNARVEAANNKIKLLIHTAYGFRNTDSLIAMVMLSCSSVRPRLPGR